MRILLIEDDEILADRLMESLTQHQYVVDAIADGQDGLEYAQSATYDLIISDVGLPNLDGITLCSRLRNEGCATPILLMTAKDMPDERVRGLDAGADDHLTKPLNLSEMHARVRALLRRGEVTPETVLQAGALRLDPVSCQVNYGSTLLKLTPKEYSLLELFMRSPNRVFSRSHIIEHLWSFDDPPLEDSVKAHIKGLRRKLKDVGAVDWIENVYGIGYRFVPNMAPIAEDSQDSGVPTPSDTPIAAATDSPAIARSTLEQTFKASMAGLWDKYQGLMTQRIDALSQAAAAIQANTLTEEIRAEAAKAAHKLAGVLGMFELDEGSDLARKVETLLESARPEERSTALDLIQRLIDHIQVTPSDLSVTPTAAAGYLLLVSSDDVLAESLQTLSESTDIVWKRVTSVEEADAWLHTSLPDLTVIDIAAASLWSPSVALVERLSQQVPAVPTLALTTTDSLVDRVEIARAGIQRVLTKPVTATQVWAMAMQLQQRHRGMTAQILVVDDDPLILKALRSLLEPWGFGVTGLEAPTRFWEILNATQPDLLILDVEMPNFSGIELCQAVRTDPTWQNTPVLFLTSHRDADTVQAVFRAGADDFISKPIVGPEVLTRILNRLERARLLQTLARQDAITGLPNYPHSKLALTQLLETALSKSIAAALVLIRISDLGDIVRQHGHDAEHAVLQAWGQCFQTVAARYDAIGYWGSGEFVVGLSEARSADAQGAMEPLFRALRRQIIELPTGIRVQPAFEWTLKLCPDAGQTLEALYQAAIADVRGNTDDFYGAVRTTS